MAPSQESGGNGVSNGAGKANGHAASPVYQNPLGMPVAICGMGMRLPGGIHHESDLYEFLVGKQDARMTMPQSRYNIDAYYSEHSKAGSIKSRHGYFLDDVDLTKFDLSMFTMTAAETSCLDPSQRLLLEVVREALESAGESDFRGKNIGTYASVFSEDWQDLQNRDLMNEQGPYQLTGKLDFMLGNRIAYEYDLRGPSMTLKAACSSSGLALHHALQAIRLGETSAAIVAGASILLAPGMAITMTAGLPLSPEGSSKTFDASADGYARAEGVNCLYIKRLDEAIRDGNPVRAVIRASTTNADGRSRGLTVPNPIAHEALIRQAYQNAGLDFSQTAMVECHGTGTAVGDPLEVEAVANCFGDHGVYIGSVKPNLGHSEGASAITSILKAVVALEHQTLIPNIKFNTPNPAIPWEKAKLTVPTEPQQWPKDRCERMSVNTFGIGGSNAHFILDSAKSFGLSSPPDMQTPRHAPKTARKTLLLFSANHTESLKNVANGCQKYLVKSPDQLESLAYTLAERREHLKLRGFGITNGSYPFQLISHTKDQRQGPGKVAFVFTGQGAQWVHMGRELIREYPSFGKSLDAMDRVLQSLEHAPRWKIVDTLLNVEDKAILAKPEFSQPICTALQIALVDFLAAWHVTPAAVIGHSSGEIAAAYAAGALSMREAVIVAFYRGYVCSMSQKRGGMAAVGLGRGDIGPYLVPGVRIACENSGKSVTLSGDVQPLEESMAAIKDDHPDTLVRKLQVEVAYHSHHMQRIGDTYYDLISNHIKPQAPHTHFISSVHAKALFEASDFGPKYWQENLEKPVLFHSAARRLLQECPDASIHLEVGPHSALAGPLRQTYAEQKSSTSQYWSSLTRGKDDTDALLETLGQLYCAGVSIRPLVSPGAQVLTQLPTYPWHHDQSYWDENRIISSWRYPRHPAHDLLGTRILEASDVEPTWRNVIRIADVPWLRDHAVGNDIVFPAAGYVAMAGEAVSQLQENCNVQIGYTIRELHLRNAMLLQDDKHTEVITTLRPKMLTTKVDSTWYEFTVMSHDGNSWSRHCRGLVNSGRASRTPKPEIKTFPRKIDSYRWYKTMAHIGLNYGPRFTGLQEVTASPTDKVISARVTDRQENSESLYALHPTTLDIIFQSWIVAQKNGVYRELKTLLLPTLIEELYVGCATSATIDFNTFAGDKQASSYGVVDGKTIFSLRGLEGTPLENEDDKAVEFNAQHLQWKPDFDFADAAKLIKSKDDTKTDLGLLERLFVLCAVEAKKRTVGVTPSQPHFTRFLAWLDKQVKRFGVPGYPLVEDSASLLHLDSQTRERMIDDCLERIQSVEARPIGIAVWRSYKYLVDIVEGRTDFLDLLLHDNILQQVYDWMNDLQDITSLFSLLGNTRPQLKILEIGAGTGGLTSKILQSLRSEYGERLYLSYTFTDVSSGFFVQAQDRFKHYDGIEYKVLDASRDPIKQGFRESEYDLIVASNVLHATPVLVETLSNCRKLLQPNGRLFLQELSPITKGASFVFGLFSGWWLGAEDGRVDEPFVDPEEWDKRLRKAGFDGTSSVTLDGPKPYYINANIIAQPAIQTTYPKRLTLMTSSQELGPLAQATQKVLQQKGYELDHCIWRKHTPPADQDLICFVDIESITKPLLKDIEEDDLNYLLQTIDELSQSTLLWLTKPAQINCLDPYNAQILGLARTVRAELAVDFATMEIEQAGDDAALAVASVLQKLQRARQVDGDLDPDMEYAWTNGAVHLSRFHWFPVGQALADAAPSPEAKRLVVGQRGMLQSLKWRGQNFEDSAPGEIRVRTSALGMNFRELMTALGVMNIETFEGRSGGINAWGGESAGYVTTVGSAVKHLKVGDRVMCMGSNSPGFATEVQRAAESCVKIPNCLSDEEAATMPVVYFTVFCCLIDKANLQKGQSLLIHSAAGGLGIAAIHVARWLGAEIYVTTGTDKKVEFLVSELGVPRERIFNSRDDSFASDIMRATNNAGVDVVLNSLSGDLLHASWKCVAEYGCMVEVGKRDVLENGQLSMSPFEANRTFTCVDANVLIKNLRKTERALEQIVKLYENGDIHPIRPVTTFDAANVEDAYRYMQQGQHVGKIVIKFPQQDTLPLAPTVPEPSFKDGSSYLLVGGTGGLGKAIASWMVFYGARSLIFLSRSAGKSVADQDFFEDLRQSGCEVHCYNGDVLDPELIRTVVKEARLPIAGVFQMAMVLRDVGVMSMDADTWAQAVRPKIDGTWNLHRHLPANLDFFVLFSSMAGLFGYFGQANYASANTFLDAFVQYRQAHGQAASVVDIGPIEDVGYVARTPGSLSGVTTNANLVSEQDFLDCLQLAIVPQLGKHGDRQQGGYSNPSQIGQVPRCNLSITDSQNTTIWKRDPRMAIYRNIEKFSSTTGEGEASDTVRTFVSSLMAEPGRLDGKTSSELLARAIGVRVSKFLMNDDQDIDLSQTLAAIGVDSLVAIELRNWWKQSFGVEVSVLELMNSGSLRQLGELAVDRLRGKYGAKKS